MWRRGGFILNIGNKVRMKEDGPFFKITDLKIKVSNKWYTFEEFNKIFKEVK